MWKLLLISLKSNSVPPTSCGANHGQGSDSALIMDVKATCEAGRRRRNLGTRQLGPLIFDHWVKRMSTVILFNQLLYYNSLGCPGILDLIQDCIWRENQPVNSVQLSEEKRKWKRRGKLDSRRRGLDLFITN